MAPIASGNQRRRDEPHSVHLSESNYSEPSQRFQRLPDIEYRDVHTADHARRVADAAAALARLIGWSSLASENLRAAAFCHDIGKNALPDNVLHETGPLNAEQMSIMRQHTWLGARQILHDISDDSLRQLAYDVCLHHHEQWNGSGYPLGLAGTRIPAAARLVAVTDVFDALTSNRCYRPAFSFDRARVLLQEGRGTLFEPQLVDAYLSMLSSPTHRRTDSGVANHTPCNSLANQGRVPPVVR